MKGDERRGESFESAPNSRSAGASARDAARSLQILPPPICLPKGGGAICGIGEKFAANPVTCTKSISVADVPGDGLSDFVRVRNGEICYWPNLGYRRFVSPIRTIAMAFWLAVGIFL